MFTVKSTCNSEKKIVVIPEAVKEMNGSKKMVMIGVQAPIENIFYG